MNDPRLPQEPENLLPFEGKAVLYPELFSVEAAHSYLLELERSVPWKQEAIKMFGKALMQPRLTAWYGDKGKSYRYSGITMLPLDWTRPLREIKEQVEACCGYRFNSALLNLYRNGSDSMGWHRDNEKELGDQPVIASLSLGAVRIFRFRHYRNKKPVLSLPLTSGSLLVMSGATQRHWEHQVPKSATSGTPRINITFREIAG